MLGRLLWEGEHLAVLPFTFYTKMSSTCPSLSADWTLTKGILRYLLWEQGDWKCLGLPENTRASVPSE